MKAATFASLKFFILYIAFQSTPPVKAATDIAAGYAALPKFQSTPPVKAATAIL